MLRLVNVSKVYQHSLVLRDVEFEIPERAIAGVIGPNGAGKSTLLKIITGFESADKGKVYLGKEEISSFADRMRVFSYMPEHVEIYPDYYVRDFIKFIQHATRYVNDALVGWLNLDAVCNKKIKHLSKGYKQRLKLFTALSNNKPILVLDEPFDGFDPIQLLDILELIKQENRKDRTFLLSIHQLNDAEKICNYYVLLNNGKVLAKGTLEALRKKFGDSTSTLEQIFIAALK